MLVWNTRPSHPVSCLFSFWELEVSTAFLQSIAIFSAWLLLEPNPTCVHTIFRSGIHGKFQPLFFLFSLAVDYLYQGCIFFSFFFWGLEFFQSDFWKGGFFCDGLRDCPHFFKEYTSFLLIFNSLLLLHVLTLFPFSSIPCFDILLSHNILPDPAVWECLIDEIIWYKICKYCSEVSALTPFKKKKRWVHWLEIGARAMIWCNE